MQIISLENKKVIAKNPIYATGLVNNIFGLLLHNKPVAMIFKTRFGIHTFFMKYPIDVIVLNNKNEVVKLKKCLKPNNIFLWNPIYSIIIELIAGTIEKNNIKISDKLQFN